MRLRGGGTTSKWSFAPYCDRSTAGPPRHAWPAPAPVPSPARELLFGWWAVRRPRRWRARPSHPPARHDGSVPPTAHSPADPSRSPRFSHRDQTARLPRTGSVRVIAASRRSVRLPARTAYHRPTAGITTRHHPRQHPEEVSNELGQAFWVTPADHTGPGRVTVWRRVEPRPGAFPHLARGCCCGTSRVSSDLPRRTSLRYTRAGVPCRLSP